METSLKDFEEWVKSLPVVEIKYFALFDPSNGKVKGIYPNHSVPDTNSKIEIDEEIAQSILEGRTSLGSFIVNTEDNKLEIVEIKNLTKIDDVLHRIIDSQWSDINDPDIILLSNKKNKKIKIELSEKFYKSRKIYWNGNTEMSFLITEYNDPNALYDIVSITIDELFNKKVVEFLVDFPQEFSVYTRRIFKNYILQHENN